LWRELVVDLGTSPEAREIHTKNLIDAALFALGWVVGKEGEKSVLAWVLAKALDDMGVYSKYISSILKRHREQPAP
jgi:hypothetical protein